jgi:hypothetical protein
MVGDTCWQSWQASPEEAPSIPSRCCCCCCIEQDELSYLMSLRHVVVDARLMTVQGLIYPEGDFELGLSGGTNTVGKFHKHFNSFRKGEYDILAEFEFRDDTLEMEGE